MSDIWINSGLVLTHTARLNDTDLISPVLHCSMFTTLLAERLTALCIFNLYVCSSFSLNWKLC